MLDQVGSDVAEQPTPQWTLGPMAHYHEVGVNLFGNPDDLRTWCSHPQLRSR